MVISDECKSSRRQCIYAMYNYRQSLYREVADLKRERHRSSWFTRQEKYANTRQQSMAKAMIKRLDDMLID